MGLSGTITLTIFLVLGCIHVATAVTYDGRPRPKDLPDVPNAAYGKLPTVYNDAGFVVECDWYGWANVKYPAAITNLCIASTWTTKIAAKAGQNTLEPYKYYYCNDKGICWEWGRGFDSDKYCYIGCFYLNGTAGLPPITAPPSVPTNQSPAPPGPTTTNTSRVNSDSGAIQQRTGLVWCAIAGAGAAALILNQLGAR